MKKILSIACFVMLVLANKMYSQTNLTWIVKDKIEDATFRTKTDFNVAVAGFTNETEVTNFCNTLRNNTDVEGCDNLGKDAKGNYSILLKMKKPFDSGYYIKLVQNIGVSYIVVNGEKKPTADWNKPQKK